MLKPLKIAHALLIAGGHLPTAGSSIARQLAAVGTVAAVRCTAPLVPKKAVVRSFGDQIFMEEQLVDTFYRLPTTCATLGCPRGDSFLTELQEGTQAVTLIPPSCVYTPFSML